MRINVTICDVKGCKLDAQHITFFKERKADGAGSMENWSYAFDLCPKHQKEFLQEILAKFEMTHQDLILKVCEQSAIRVRSE